MRVSGVELGTPTSNESMPWFIRATDLLSALLAAPIAMGLRDPMLFYGAGRHNIRLLSDRVHRHIAGGVCLSPWAEHPKPRFVAGRAISCRGISCGHCANRSLRLFSRSVGRGSAISTSNSVPGPLCAHAGRPHSRDWAARSSASMDQELFG